MENEHRRSPRIMFSIPVSVRGVDEKGNPFETTARTITLNRHGARLQVSRSLKPGQTVHLTNQGNAAAADFRVGYLFSSHHGGFRCSHPASLPALPIVVAAVALAGGSGSSGDGGVAHKALRALWRFYSLGILAAGFRSGNESLSSRGKRSGRRPSYFGVRKAEITAQASADAR